MVVRVHTRPISLPLDFIIFLLYIRFSAVFESERWKSIMNHPVHTNLELLLLELPDFCLQSKAVNIRSYEGAFNKWCKWCVLYSISTLPASDVNVSLYLMHLSKFKKSTSTINEAFYAISWAHNIAGVVNPCNSKLVSFVKEGALRAVGHFVNKKEPITPEILRQIVLVYGNVDAHLKDLRFACMCLLCFSGFILRFSELANLKCNNVIFYSDHVKLVTE